MGEWTNTGWFLAALTVVGIIGAGVFLYQKISRWFKGDKG